MFKDLILLLVQRAHSRKLIDFKETVCVQKEHFAGFGLRQAALLLESTHFSVCRIILKIACCSVKENSNSGGR